MIVRSPEFYDNTTSYIGNGEMIVCESGPEIKSVQCGYSAPCILSVVPDRLYESESERLVGSDIYYHKIFFPESFADAVPGICPTPDLVFTDFMDPDRNVFVRHCECISGISLKLLIPGYVKRNLYDRYKLGRTNTDVLVLGVPANTQYYENLVSRKDKRMLILVSGDAAIFDSGIILKPGNADIVFVCGGPTECIENAVYALKNIGNDSDIMLRSKAAFEKLCAGIDDPLIESALISLAVRQAKSGAVLASDQLPLADIGALLPLIEVFDRLSLESQAERMIGYYLDLYSGDGADSIHTYSSLDSYDVIPDVDSGKAASYLLKAFMYYFDRHEPDHRSSMLMKKAFYIAASSMNQGMVPYSGGEDELFTGIIPAEYIDQASSDATIEVMTACRDFIGFARRHKIRLKSGGSSCREDLEKAFGGFEKIFFTDGCISANSYRIIGTTKNTRFIYSRCPGCVRKRGYAPISLLERDRTGFYRCQSCYEKKSNEECNIAEKIPSICSSAKALYYGMLSQYAGAKVYDTLVAYKDRLVNGIRDIPVRTALTDVWVFKALRSAGDDVSDLRAALEDLTDSEETLSSLISGDTLIGRPADSRTTAYFLAALLNT